MRALKETASPAQTESGRLIYVIGASGAGKDSLLSYSRSMLSGGYLFASRYITRPADAGGENHIALSMEEFEHRVEAGLFALWWRSHDRGYGIGLEIDVWLKRGMTVIINGSRAYLSEALRRYPKLQPLLIEVESDILRQRLQQRGRESEEEIDKRVERAIQFATLDHPALSRISNNRTLEEAGEKLLRFIQG